MLEYIIFSIIFLGMLTFVVGAVFLSTEEKQYRYGLNITDEHEI